MVGGCSKSGKKPDTKKPEIEAANNEPKKSNDIAIATGEATSFRKDLRTGVKMWEIAWKSANLGVEDNKQFGHMFRVTGSTYTAIKEKDGSFRSELATTFSAEEAEADKAKDRLILTGKVTVNSNREPRVNMSAKKVEWMPDLKVFKASGDVLIESDKGVIGPIDSLYSDPELHKVATSLEYFKK